MSSHDPMCRIPLQPAGVFCQCDLIARVRADERERGRREAAEEIAQAILQMRISECKTAGDARIRQTYADIARRIGGLDG